jgi:hypothetical protein
MWLLRIALVRVVIFFVLIMFRFFIVFLIGLFSKTDIVSYQAIREDKVKAFWIISVHAQWYASPHLGNDRVQSLDGSGIANCDEFVPFS